MKTQNPWIGRMKGSAGSMTGCKVYDKNVMRAKAFEVSNPKTKAQQTERGFFAQLIAAVATLSDAQLRTLYPQKPKTKSRRNMLTTQLSSAFSVDGTTKSLDFANVQQFGNGAQSLCPLLKMEDYFDNGAFLLNPAWAPNFKANETSFVLVVFHGATGAISMYDIPPVDPERPEEPEPVEVPEYPEPDPMDYGVCMPTLDGLDHSGDAFGTYAVMSMKKGGGSKPGPTPPTPSTPFPTDFGGTGNSYTKNAVLEAYVGEEFAETYTFGPTYQIQDDEDVVIFDSFEYIGNGYVRGVSVTNILPDVPISTRCEAPNGEVEMIDGTYDVA